MFSFRKNATVMLTALFALFVFAGDLVADEVGKVSGACCSSETQESDSDQEHCPACACAVQNGAVVRSDTVALVSARMATVELVFEREDRTAPDGVRAAIDHPPQLA